MSIAQYKDSNRAELWAIVQIQAIEYEAALKRIAELEKIGLELVSIIECHHESAYCDVFDYEELKAAKEALKEQGE